MEKFRIRSSGGIQPLNHKPLDGKYLVTGSTGVLGSAVVNFLLSFPSTELVCVSRNEDRLAQQFTSISKIWPERITAISVDWETEDAYKIVLREARNIAGLVHCAGSYGHIAKLSGLQMNHWLTSVSRMLTGALNTVKLTYLASQLGHVSSVLLGGGGGTEAYAGLSAYSVAKTGVARIVESAAIETPASQASFNVIGPGPTRSTMVDEALSNQYVLDPRILRTSRLLLEEDGNPGIEKFLAGVGFLLSSEGRIVSGRYLSSQWDNWQSLISEPPLGADDYKLRRVFK